MKEITVSGRTLNDAITEALIELEVTSDLLEYEVIEKGSDGFLGIGRKQAVIKAWKKAVKAEESYTEEIKREMRNVVTEIPVKKEFTPESKQYSRGPKPEKKEYKKPEPKKYEKKKQEPVLPVSAPAEELPLVEVTQETKDACEKFLKDILTTMNIQAEIETCVDNEGALSFDIKGEHMGILIGKRGQTLDSLQYLANRVANKHQEGFVRVKLDTENYRKRRKETLEHLAMNIASKVKRSRRPVSLEPMNPYERRIIHSALQADKYISTHSEGEEPFRHVVVAPSRDRRHS